MPRLGTSAERRGVKPLPHYLPALRARQNSPTLMNTTKLKDPALPLFLAPVLWPNSYPMSNSPAPVVRNPWSWVTTSYFAEGIPFALVIWVAGTMFKDLGHSDGQITLATASIGIAWSLKPFWAAFLDMYRTKKFFVLAMELLMAGLLIGIALALPLPNYFQIVIAVLWVMAFASSTQDICVDGIYLTTLDEKKQAAYIGVQGVFWNVGKLFGTAL